MRAENAVRRLVAAADAQLGRVVVVAAHPDDETIGAGALLARAKDAWVLHATDGAPRERALWPAALRDATREEYARARKKELHAALAIANVSADRALAFGAVDQEAVFALVPLARWIASRLVELAPSVVVTHPYEGGHPDHDAVAFASHAAIRLLAASRVEAPALIEAASYHARGDQLAVDEFLAPARGAIPTWSSVLSASARVTKERMIAAHASQREVLAPFPRDVERFRVAPVYDFAAPAHAGSLRYEQLGWPMTGARFRELAQAAVHALGESSTWL